MLAWLRIPDSLAWWVVIMGGIVVVVTVAKRISGSSWNPHRDVKWKQRVAQHGFGKALAIEVLDSLQVVMAVALFMWVMGRCAGD